MSVAKESFQGSLLSEAHHRTYKERLLGDHQHFHLDALFQGNPVMAIVGIAQADDLFELGLSNEEHAVGKMTQKVGVFVSSDFSIVHSQLITDELYEQMKQASSDHPEQQWPDVKRDIFLQHMQRTRDDIFIPQEQEICM